MRRVGWMAAVVSLGVAAAGCGSSAPGPGRTPIGTAASPARSARTTATPSPIPSGPDLIAGTRSVHFRSADGVRLAGRLFGHGPTVVILSHMGPGGNDQTEWWPMASVLAGRGYRVLTYDYSGICPGGAAGCSKGSTGTGAPAPNLTGAIRFAKTLGARRVVLGGASMGAMASLKLAARPGVDVAAVISLSGLEGLFGPYALGRNVISRISEPKLFLAGRYDDEAASSARHWMRWSKPPKRGQILDTGLHGTDMIDLASGADADIPGIVVRSVVGFLDRYAPAHAG